MAVSFAEPTHPPNQHNDSWVGAPGGYVQRWARHEEASGEAWVRACFVYKFLRVFIIGFFLLPNLFPEFPRIVSSCLRCFY